MKYRIPPAVVWLVATRRQVAGRLANAERRLAAAKSKIAEVQASVEEELRRVVPLVEQLRSDLRSLDATIRMHDMGIDPDALPPLRIQLAAIAKPQAKNSFTRSIFACLRHEPSHWKTTTEIATFVARACHPDLSPAEFPLYRYHVRKRIQGLVKQGKLQRLPGRAHYQEGRYRLGDQHGYAWLTDSEAQQFDVLLENSLGKSGTAQPDLFDGADR